MDIKTVSIITILLLILLSLWLWRSIEREQALPSRSDRAALIKAIEAIKIGDADEDLKTIDEDIRNL
ncbi:MAG: hypothetical protein AAB796_00555 [Patescibacteria group bacterium]